MTPRELEVQEKQEQLQGRGEKTEASRYYLPQTDIHESAEALFVTMDMPGVGKDSVNIEVEKNVLTISGKIDFSKYEDLKPIYTEYNVGNYGRSFTLASTIDNEAISAKLNDGVLELRLPKVKEATARKIEIESQ